MASRKFSKETKNTSEKSKMIKKTAPARKATTKTAAKFEEKELESVVDAPVGNEVEENRDMSTQSSASSANKFKIKKSYIILFVVLLVLAGSLYFGRGLLVAAVVNGQPVSRWEVVQATEKQSGKQSLNNLVRNVLIEQEAKKQNVSVSDGGVDKQVKEVENNLKKQGQKLEDVLALQGMTKDDLRKLIRLDQLVGKMVGKDIKISDKQVTEYIEKNKDVLGMQDQKEDEMKKSIKEQLKQQELNEKVQKWLADAQSKANVLYFVEY